MLDGRACAKKILDDLKIQVVGLSKTPRLDIVLVGEDFASQQYVSIKEQVAQEIGIQCIVHKFSQQATTKEIIQKVRELNHYDEVTGFMLQLPLPTQIDRDAALDEIDWKKDVDGLTAHNLGLIYQRRSHLVPATAIGVIKLLEKYDIEISGKDVVILGAGLIAGVPLAGLFLEREATVTVCHERSQNPELNTRKADILVSATGKARLVDADWIKEGAVVVDVGIEKDPVSGKTVGDVDFDSVSKKTSLVTPVPGGVGPMTVACLMMNLVKIARENDN